MLLDTDVMVDFLRGYGPAVNWLTTTSSPIALPGLVAMELLQGVETKPNSNSSRMNLRGLHCSGHRLPIVNAHIEISPLIGSATASVCSTA